MAHRVVSRQPGRPPTPRSGNRAARITNRARRPGALRFARLGTQRGSCAPGTRASRRRKRVSGTPCLPRPRLHKAKAIVATTTTANARSACYTLERQSRETRARNVVHATTPRAPFLLYDTDSLAVWGSRITSSIQARECSGTTTPPSPLRFQSCLGKVREEVKKLLTPIS